ncbi:MAG: hypothetical protein NTV02_02665 [Candidatus Zambryskibacteria bacterium]|nr:hypothetical protein [Candidatus Zambryskibacteria bacterium]
MPYRAVKHIFTGSTTPITSYDATKTNLGTLIVQKTGTLATDKYVGPLPVATALPMQEAVSSVGTVQVATTAVTGTSTNFQTSMIGMSIGFGSTDPAKVTAWYSISARASTTGITLGSSAGTVAAGTAYVIVYNTPMMFPHVITYSSTIDWVFMIENLATAVAPRKICLYEYSKTTSVYTWKGFIIATLTSATAHTLRGFRAMRYLHTTGTVAVSTTTVTGSGTKFVDDGIAVGARIGFGSTDPTAISTWYVISAIGSETGITLATSAGTISAGSAYVIEELRFAITATNATVANGGLHLVKGVNYSDFTLDGSVTIAAATTTDNIKAVYWLSDAGTPGNVVTNQASCGLMLTPESNKGLHYAYVLDGFGSTFARVFRYNLRATGTITSGKMLMGIAYTTSTSSATTVTVSGTSVTASGAVFNSTMVGERIAFSTTSITNVVTWYTIASFTSSTVITLSASAGSIGPGAAFIVDSADVISTSPQPVTGTLSAVNNGRIGTLNHGQGAGELSLYFVTTTRIYRAAVSKLFDGNLGWISENRPEIPTGSVSTFPATNALNMVEIADDMDRLIVLTTGTAGIRQYVTRYPMAAGDAFDHIWGVDDKQQDQASSLGNAYVSSGTVAVSTVTVTGTNTFFVASMVGYRIGFGSTDPTAIVTWYTISAFTSITSITLSSSAGTIGAGSTYVIDWNSNTIPHFNSASQVTSAWSENGITHIVKHGTTTALSQMYSLPLSAHSTFAASTNQRVITPTLSTPDCFQFRNVAASHDDSLSTGEFALNAEPYQVYFRINGIDTNTGEWTLIDSDGDLTGVPGSTRIQFMFQFTTIGANCIPARIMSVTVVYDDTAISTDSRFQPSAGLSNPVSKQFVWRFATAFGGTVPTLRVRLYNAVTNDLLVDDYTTSTNSGTWEKSTNSGGAWGAYNTTDKGNETTYIRYTPSSLGDNIKVRAVLTQ